MTATDNIKHSLTPLQINIKSHTKRLLISAPATGYNIYSFQEKKIIRHENKQGEIDVKTQSKH